MAIQFLIPGWGYLDQTSGRQYLVPGWGFVNETGPSHFTSTLTESVTASDSFSSSAAAAVGLSESVVASDTFSPTPVDRQYLVPGWGYLNESTGKQYLVPGWGYVNDTSPYRFNAGVSLHLTDPLSESVTASDSLASRAAFHAATADFVFASDVPPFPPNVTALLGRALLGAFVPNMGYPPQPSITNSGSSALLGQALLGAFELNGSGGSVPSPTFAYPYVQFAFNAAVSEAVTAIDTSQVMAVFSELLAEGVVASGTYVSFFVVPTPPSRIIEASVENRPPAPGTFFLKTAAEVEDFTIDWGDEIGDDIIIGSTWCVGQAGLSIDAHAPSFTGTSTTVWLSGGTVEELYIISNIITTDGGRTLEQQFQCLIYA